MSGSHLLRDRLGLLEAKRLGLLRALAIAGNKSRGDGPRVEGPGSSLQPFTHRGAGACDRASGVSTRQASAAGISIENHGISPLSRWKFSSARLCRRWKPCHQGHDAEATGAEAQSDSPGKPLVQLLLHPQAVGQLSLEGLIIQRQSG